MIEEIGGTISQNVVLSGEHKNKDWEQIRPGQYLSVQYGPDLGSGQAGSVHSIYWQIQKPGWGIGLARLGHNPKPLYIRAKIGDWLGWARLQQLST